MNDHKQKQNQKQIQKQKQKKKIEKKMVGEKKLHQNLCENY